MSFCPACGSNLEGHETVCPHCGAPLQADAAETADASQTAQWAPPAFEENAPSGPDEDWTVALWGEREEPPVTEEDVPPTIHDGRFTPPVIEETIPLPSRRSHQSRQQQWYENRLVLALIALNVILFVGLILAVLDENETVVTPPVASVAPTPIAVTPQPTNAIPPGEGPGSPTPIAVTPAPTPAPTPATGGGTWTQVASLEGSGPKKGPLFELTGGEAKLIYTVQGDELAGVAIYVVKEGESIDEQGGSPDVNHQGAGSDETRIVKPAGRYYLDVNSANATWSVRVEELR